MAQFWAERNRQYVRAKHALIKTEILGDYRQEHGGFLQSECQLSGPTKNPNLPNVENAERRRAQQCVQSIMEDKYVGLKIGTCPVFMTRAICHPLWLNMENPQLYQQFMLTRWMKASELHGISLEHASFVSPVNEDVKHRLGTSVHEIKIRHIAGQTRWRHQIG